MPRNGISRIRDRLREHIDETEKQEWIERLASAIAERRYRDLVDFIAQLESSIDWSTALEYLIKSTQTTYEPPSGLGIGKIELEPLKCREVVFSLFSCSGFEPVDLGTIDLLQELEDEDSFVSSRKRMYKELVEVAEDQIRSGDTLYFFPYLISSPPENQIRLYLEQVLCDELKSMVLPSDGNVVDITPLWYTEHGRQALSNLGVHGTSVQKQLLDSVISVLQVSQDVKDSITLAPGTDTDGSISNAPTNSVYRDLHTAVISQDISKLTKLGSKFGVPVLSSHLSDAAENYQETMTSSNYRNLLQLIHSHVLVRCEDSLFSFQQIYELKQTRLSTAVLFASSNFYTDSSVRFLTEILCNTNNTELASIVMRGLKKVAKKHADTRGLLNEVLGLDCTHYGRISRVLSDLR